MGSAYEATRPVANSDRRGYLRIADLRVKALALVIRKHVIDVPGLDALLVALPESRVQQLGVVLHEHLAHERVAEQKRRKGFGEHVFGADAVPDLARHLVFFVARLRHLAKVAVGDVFDLVVVVKHHFAVAGDAKVLEQHVAGEDVGRHQVFQGVAVLDDAALDLLARPRRRRAGVVGVGAARVKRLLQVNIERNHAAFNIDVLDDDFNAAVAVTVADLQLAGRKLFKLGDQFIVKARARKTHFAVFQRVGHAPHPVVLLDQQILGLDLLARGVLGRRVKVLDDLEHVRKRGQVKHQHHHALDAGRDTELVGGVALVVQKVAVKKRLALLGQPQGVVNFVARLARHHAAQVLHVGRRYFHIHHEIGPRKAEQHQQVILAKQDGINHQLALLAVQHRQCKPKLVKAVDQLANDVATLVAKKQTGEHLKLEIGAQLDVPQLLGHGHLHPRSIAAQVSKRAAQIKVQHHLHQHFGQAVVRRVVGAVGRAGLGLVVFNVLGTQIG